MAIKESAKKALRQSERRNIMNSQRKKKVKNLIKEVNVLIGGKKAEEAKKLLPQIYKALDKTAKKNTIKKNTASRKKSRLTKMINKASSK
ncbi:MAG: 30S ribosomal protein S20 [Candidatus Pacebacteria bacterium]|nr:30S ribosomal protein S20 [Candidatus Paceibacterota bacterium]